MTVLTLAEVELDLAAQAGLDTGEALLEAMIRLIRTGSPDETLLVEPILARFGEIPTYMTRLGMAGAHASSWAISARRLQAQTFHGLPPLEECAPTSAT